MCECVCVPCASLVVPQKPEETNGSPSVLGGGEPPCGSWELILGLLHEQQVLSPTGPSPQPCDGASHSLMDEDCVLT